MRSHAFGASKMPIQAVSFMHSTYYMSEADGYLNIENTGKYGSHLDVWHLRERTHIQTHAQKAQLPDFPQNNESERARDI